MNENSKENKEVIRLFIVGDDSEEVQVVNDDFIRLEITNTEDENFEFTEPEVDLTGPDQLHQEDAVLLDNIKVEVIEDPEAEFGDLLNFDIYQPSENEHDESEAENEIPKGNERLSYKRKTSRFLSERLLNRKRKLHSCKICGYTSHQKSHYRRHLTIHSKPDGIRCSICRKPMFAKVELTDHMEEHRCPEDYNRFQCNLCPYTSNKLTNVSQHTDVHYKPVRERLRCEDCNFSTTNRLRFRNHVKIHLNRSTKCPVCLKVFKTMSLRRRHVQRYKSPDDPSRFQCPECSYNTIKFNNFKQHMVVHRSEFEVEMFQCPYCPFRSKRKTDLRQHVLVKHKSNDEVTLYQCDFCTYETKRGNHLASHMKNRHGKDLVLKKCGLCSYKTVSQVLIERHIKIHSKIPEKFFLCSICGFGCQSLDLLNEHINLKHENTEIGENDDDDSAVVEIKTEEHSPQLDYSCEFVKVEKIDPDLNEKSSAEMAVYCCQFHKCGFVANVERDAKIHLTICHNKRGDDNKCPECTFHTTSRYLYLDHLKVHRIDIEHLKPHLCEICGTRWIRQGDLTRHMAVHWNEGQQKNRSYKFSEESTKQLLGCRFCNYQTRIRLCLYKHMKKHDEVEISNFTRYIDDREDDNLNFKINS